MADLKKGELTLVKPVRDNEKERLAAGGKEITGPAIPLENITATVYEWSAQQLRKAPDDSGKGQTRTDHYVPRDLLNQAPGPKAASCLEQQTQRVFASGASRDTEEGKLDYEGFISPMVLLRYAQYMHSNRQMKDGSLRSSDNWQKGIPPTAYLKSLLRHVMDVWLIMRGRSNYAREDLETALCGVLFNVNGLLFEALGGTLTEIER